MRLLARGPAALILFATSVALAQPAEPPPNPRAEALNDEGKKLYAENKDYGGAAQKFEAAIARMPRVRDLAFVTGRFDYHVRVACADVDELDKTVRGVRDAGAAQTETRIVLRAASYHGTL